MEVISCQNLIKTCCTDALDFTNSHPNIKFTMKLNRKKQRFKTDMSVFGPHRGTAAIGPFIAALKDGRTVTYEGKEVPCLDALSLSRGSQLRVLTLLVLCCRSDPSRSVLPLTRDRSSSSSSVRRRSSSRRFAPTGSWGGSPGYLFLKSDLN